MTITYHYTRNKTPLRQAITENQIFYDEDFPKFCSCNCYVRYSESKKTWMEIQTDGETIIRENHSCRYIPVT